MILDRFRVTDQVAIVTGAGRGIGAASAIGLAEAGADVLISARTTSQLDEVAERIRALGRRVHVVAADVNDLDQAAALADEAVDHFGKLNIVVNNVGGALPNSFVDTSVKQLEGAFHFNVSTAHALTQAAIPHLLRSDDASVINISSVVGRAAARGYLAYGTVKAALAHYTKLAALDLNPRIRVNAIACGSIMTSALEIVASDKNLMAEMTGATPLREVGIPEDIAAAVVYLSSPAGRYLTGKVLEVDGGLQVPNFSMPIPDVES
ncbi:MAG TPA: SDR family oxidoreductase [Marmoricola sp.]|nr:SDR family oxidoreductase [Nocardioidaceae bacterium]HRV69221.1 SDR family oxidoreductase [Marmoricola sp.]